MHHDCPEVERAMNALAEALCMWERDTGIGSTLVFVPEGNAEVIVLENGKPIPRTETADILRSLAETYQNRGDMLTYDAMQDTASVIESLL